MVQRRTEPPGLRGDHPQGPRRNLGRLRSPDSVGGPLVYQPHDFRRIFVTDAILSGLPPHIAQVICGHKSITTTMGYKATYPPKPSKPTGASSPAAGPPAPAMSIEPPPKRNGTPSSRTSRSARSPSAPALAPFQAFVFMNTLAFVARSSGRTRPSAVGWRRSATTSSPASPKPNMRAGSARSKVSASAWPAPKTSSPRSTHWPRGSRLTVQLGMPGFGRSGETAGTPRPTS